MRIEMADGETMQESHTCDIFFSASLSNQCV
jgi:hypothetical protein